MKPLSIVSVAAFAATVFFIAARSDAGVHTQAHEGATGARAQLASEKRAHVSIPHLELDTYAGLASACVLADVRSSRVIDEAGILLRTEYVLDVVDAYFGDAGSTVKIQVPGGRTSSREFVVDGAPRLEAGQRALFFVGGPVEGDARGLLGLERGCYSVQNADSGLVVTGHHAPGGVPLDAFVERTLLARESFFTQEVR